jgi:hypothetical protein
MELFVVFRLLSIVLGLVLGFFSYKIYITTKDGTNRGWFYLSVAGLMLCIWACVQAITVIFFDLPTVKIISSLVCFSVISLVVPLGIINLNKSFRIETHKFFSEKSLYIIYLGLWTVLIFFNLIIWQFSSILMEFAGIAHLMLSFMFIFALYPAFKLWRTTKVWTWLLIFLFVIFTAVSIIPGAYTSGCCNDRKANVLNSINDANVNACEKLQLDYAEIIPLQCSNDALLITKNYHYLLLTGIVIAVVAFYGLWRKIDF